MTLRRILAFIAAGAFAAIGLLGAVVVPNGCTSGPPGPGLRQMSLMRCYVDQRFGLRFAIALGGLFVASAIGVMAIRGLRVRSGQRDRHRSTDGAAWWYARGTLLLLLAAAMLYMLAGGCEPWSWFSCGHLPFGTATRGLIVSLPALAIVALVAIPARWPISRGDGRSPAGGSLWPMLAFAVFAAGVVLALAWPGGCGPLGPLLACWPVPRLGLRIGTMFAAATVAVWLTAFGALGERRRTGRSPA
jgi:hypothetical protein